MYLTISFDSMQRFNDDLNNYVQPWRPSNNVDLILEILNYTIYKKM